MRIFVGVQRLYRGRQLARTHPMTSAGMTLCRFGFQGRPALGADLFHASRKRFRGGCQQYDIVRE